MPNLNNSFLKPRIVVTGALSYLGQHLWRALKRDGWHPVALVRDGSEERAREADIPKGDLFTLPADPRIWTNFLTQLSPDAAIHLASINASKNFADDDLFDIHLVNIHLPVCLAQALARSQCTKKGSISSLILAGSHWQTVDGKPHDPLDHYAASKQAAEEMLRPIAAEQAGVRVISLRLGDVYGPRDPRRKFLNLVVDALSHDVVLQASPGMQGVDLVHIDDAVSSFIHALKHSNKIGTGNVANYGVTSGNHMTLRDLVITIEGLAARSCRIQWGAIPYRAREIFAPTPGENLPGWKPSISCMQGLKEILKDRKVLRDGLD